KLNPSGTGLVYATYLGGSVVAFGGLPDAITRATAIAIDSSGEVFVTGNTNAVDFPTTPGALQTLKLNTNGKDTGFVTKIDAAGNGLVYSSYLGGSKLDQPTAIAVDASGNAYVAGATASDDFPVTSSALQKHLAGSENAFVSEVNATGNQLVYSTYLGGNGSDQVNAIALRPSKFSVPDSRGLVNTVDIYVAGTTNSANFPTTNGALRTKSDGNNDAFVAELSPLASGQNQLVYSTFLGGSQQNIANGIALDSAGDAFVAGQTYSTDFPTKNAYQTQFSGNEDAFVSEINPTGSALVYSTLLGGSSDTIAYAIAVDASGETYVAGQTDSTDFPTTPDAPQTYMPAATSVAFVTKFNAAGNALVYSTYLGGGGGTHIFQNAIAIALDPFGEAYVAGFTNSPVFPTTPGAVQTSYPGAVAISGFVAKVATTALPLTVAPLTATEGASFTGVVGFFVDEAPGFSSGEGGSNSNYAPLIAWGDGNTSVGTVVPYQNGVQILGTHTYGEDGSYSLAVSVSDFDGDSATASANVAVADAPLSIVSKQDVPFTEGVALARTVASFEDTDPRGGVGDYSATILWGDGQTTPGTVVADGAIFDVIGVHQYAEDGSHLIAVAVQDAGGASTSSHAGTFGIAAVADSLAAKPINLSVIGNKSFTGQVATFTDPDNSLPGTADYTATITWDDGTSSPGTVSVVSGSGPTAAFTVSGTHQFASFAGYHTISVAITDLDDGGVTTVIDSVLDPSGLTPNQIYVINAYQSAFGTAGTTDTVVAGHTLAGWAARLDAGATLASFATALLHSGEYYGLLIGGLYQQYLGRTADSAGLVYWVGQLQQGMTDEQIEAAFAGANEFYQHAGGTDAGWVRAMYLDILGRAADAGGLASWTGQLSQGANRSAVAQGFAASVERETQRINDDYFTDLGRPADPAGQAHWVNAFEHGLRNEDVIAGFLASPEYYQAHSS
ncbi:MAG TPA: SBBP repeat-containing protein, partial [Pirellulales bacterium]|nr:SBBP repeat-containing protein [Pirellulales bacterium]